MRLAFGVDSFGVDGFGAFNGISGPGYSMWLVVLANYNIPPWLTIKKEHLILVALIPSMICTCIYEHGFPQVHVHVLFYIDHDDEQFIEHRISNLIPIQCTYYFE